MITILRESLWSQFGATIDMLHASINKCDDTILASNKRMFFMAYHTIVFLDYYLTLPPKDFKPKLPFTIKDLSDIPDGALDDVVPDKIYTRQELLDYLSQCRIKCHQLINNLTETNIHDRFIEDLSTGSMNYNVVEILLYNMRHVQHHTAQLNLHLRQTINRSPNWISRAKEATY